MNNFGIFNTSSIIIDLGSDSVKAGLSTEDKPSSIFSSIIGTPKFKKILSLNTEKEILSPSDDTRGLYNLKNAIVRGELKNEDHAKLIFQKVYNDLKLINNKEIPVFIAEPPYTSKKQKNMISEILFENLETPSIFFGTQGVLSLYSYGKKNGVILESGEGITQVVPVFEGYKLDSGIELIDFGGFDVTNHLKNTLRNNGVFINSTSEDYIVKDMKEKICKLNDTQLNQNQIKMMTDFFLKDEENQKDDYVYKLPDGEEVVLNSERYISPEILFNPSINGSVFPGLHEMLYNSVQQLDVDLRKTLFENVMLSGGNTAIEGFSIRFINELQPLLSDNTKLQMTVSNFDKTYMVWKGGNIISNIGSFSKLWISKKEYQEQGDRIFLKKKF